MRFPDYSDSQAKDKIADLVRLMDLSLTDTEYLDARRASRLLATLMTSYRRLFETPGEQPDQFIGRAQREGTLFGLALAAAFDLVSNVEYLHGRVVNSKWIYCHRNGEDTPQAYYSFLKQCPRCCLDMGLGARISGAQHKPTSHHIGEISTVVTALLLHMIASAAESPLAIATITKQSHDVDAIGFNKDTLVLFEVKASPMVTFPVVVDLPELLLTESGDEAAEYAQHSLVDMVGSGLTASLFVPHRNWRIPLGEKRGNAWPYEQATEFFLRPESFRDYLSAWLELYYAYCVPKVERTGRTVSLAYLVNGWGDEIDSNKTKPGLGRTDDIKKGTYQLIKFGAYYRDDKSHLKVRSALVANLDPVSLRRDYLDKLVDIRWGFGKDFHLVEGEYRIAQNVLRQLYDGVLTFNRPVLNDPLLRELCDLRSVERCLLDGRLDTLLEQWLSAVPTQESLM